MELKKHVLNLLKRIGLTDTEARFYLTAYRHPQKTLAELQKLAGFSRASVYRAFHHLHHLKLLTSSPDNWRKNVEAVSLRSIVQRLAKESLKFRKIELELKKTENFMNLSNYEQAEPVEIFTDQNQITEQCYKLINAGWSHISCYGSAEKAYDIPGEKAMADFVSMRARKRRTIDAVFTEPGKRTDDLLQKNHQELRNGKFYLDSMSQNVMTYIYDKQVTIWQKDEELGNRVILIHDPGLIKMYQSNFDRTWKSLP